MAESVVLVVTDALLLKGEHVAAGEVLEVSKELGHELLSSGRCRKATPEELAAGQPA